MSKISLAPAVAGTGIFTIASPGTNTNRTLTLPDDTGTIVTNSGNQAGSFTTLNTSGQVVFNDAGANVDFRVEGDTDANLLFVDASADAVGIGTNAPAQKLDIIGGTANGSGIVNTLRLRNTGTTVNDGAKILFTAGTSTDGAGIGSGGQALNSADLRFFAGGNTERMRITSDGFLRMASGSGGIQFNGDTAAANALDDYEEGTWTPAWSNGGGTPTYTAITAGSYTKIGNMCAAWGVVTSSALTQSVNTVNITLPFTVKNQQSSYGAVSIFPEEGINPAGGAGNLYGITNIGAAAFQLYTIASSTTSNYIELTFNNLQAAAATRIRFCVVFEVA